MVSEDHGGQKTAAVLLTALLTCGCLQPQTVEAPYKPTTVGVRSKAAGPDDGPVALAVAKPPPAGTAPTLDGPDLNPVQPVSARADSQAPETAPPPRPQPVDPSAPQAGQPGTGQPGVVPPQPLPQGSPAPGGPAPGSPAPGIPAPGQRQPSVHSGPEPAFPTKKPDGTPYPPGSAGLVPAGGLPIDPHRRAVPTATGGLLNLPPGESPVERAVDLSYRLQALDQERQMLDTRARELTAALEIRDRVLAQHGHDIHEAAEEVARAREQVTSWRKELEEARTRLRSREQEDVQTLKAVIALLERLIDTGSGHDVRHDSPPERMPEE